MKVIYIPIGYTGCYSNLYGAYSDEGKAKKRLAAVKKQEAADDVHFIQELVLDEDAEVPV